MERIPWSSFLPMRNSDDEESLRPAELARLSGLSKDTLRHYERKGLLASRRLANGYREYPRAALGRVRVVQRALSVGFTLDELARLLRIRERGGAPCRQVRKLAALKLEAIDEQLRDLRTMRSDLRAMLADWDERLAKTARGKRAWLLERWSTQPSPRALRDSAPPARKLHSRRG